jgi:hypothetical protein
MELKRAKTTILNHNGEQLSDYEKSILQYDGANIYHTNLNPCFLHFTTDEEPKEGEWVIVNGGLNRIGVDKYQTNVNYSIKPRKIVSSTDKSLIAKKEIIGKDDLGYLFNNIHLSQPSEAFIKKYVEVGGIDEVDIEYERVYEDQLEGGEFILRPTIPPEYGIKVDSHNTITIHPIKDSWNLEEVTELIYNVAGYILKHSSGTDVSMDIKEWIKLNIK